MNFFTKLFSTFILLITLSIYSQSQTVYTWNGSVNSSFSTAGNWTPVRQVGMVTDILVFENSGNLNVTNVYQVTIGQLIIRNNTNLILTPATGNAKLVTIKGAAGEDFVIESGSGLKVIGNDPSLNIYLSTSATACINGSLTFQGTTANYLNAADALAIRFKNGSTFNQLCPGSIFNTIGISNAVVFESGSTFRINHSAALTPFGLSAPDSKVLFESSSNLVVSNISSLQLAGRTIADLTVDCSLNIAEQFAADIYISNLTVLNNASLILTNNNSNYLPALNISGNLNVNGSFKFSELEANKFIVNFNGTSVQNISGNGEILIPANLNRFELSNSITLQRDLAVNCRIIPKRNEINKNGFHFTFNPEFGDPFNGRREIGVKNPSNKTVSNSTLNTPTEFSLSQNYPNPFNPSTKIDLALPVDSKVSIKIYDINGREIADIANGYMNAGFHTFNFNASNLSSGVYFYTINAGNFTKTMKMILAK